MNSTAASFEKLGDTNYETWRLQMRSVLIFNDLWPCIVEESSDKKDENEWKKKDEKALALILLSIKENQVSYIRKTKTSREAWHILEKVHSSKGPVRKVMLYRNLFQMKKTHDQSMADHLRNFQDSVDKLEEVGVSLPSELKVIMILSTLPENYENFSIAIESRDELPDIESLKIKLIEEKNRRKFNEVASSESPQNALYSTDKNPKVNVKGNQYNKKYNRIKNMRFNGICFVCGKSGHKASVCRYKKNNQREDNAMITTELVNMRNEYDKNTWILDSGASAHMCNDSKLFIKLNANIRLNVHTADGKTINAYGIGEIALYLKNKRDKATLKEVLYVPELKQNLLSVSRAVDHGYRIIFTKTKAVIRNINGQCIMEAVKKDKLFVVQTCNHHVSVLVERSMVNAKSISTPMEVNIKPLLLNEHMSEEEEKEMKPKQYRELIGCLTYVANTVRPDIAYSVNLLSRFCNEPRRIHWEAGKRILKYLKGTKNYSIKYEKSNERLLKGYSDSDWAGDMLDRKSCSGFLVMMSGGPVSWKSKKQNCVALSTMEAEYIALSELMKEIMYFRNILGELKFEEYCTKETNIYCDNQSTIKLCLNNESSRRAKHIDIRLHYCKDVKDSKCINLNYIETEKMIADILTKNLNSIKFGNCVKLLKLN